MVVWRCPPRLSYLVFVQGLNPKTVYLPCIVFLSAPLYPNSWRPSVALVDLSLKMFLALQLKVKTISPLSDREDKKVQTDKEFQQDDLKKMGEVKEIAEFFNMVPKKECQEFLAMMCETIGAAPKGVSYYKPAPCDFPLDGQDEDDNVNKEAAEPDYKAIYEAYAKKERDAANAMTSVELNSGSAYSLKTSI